MKNTNDKGLHWGEEIMAADITNGVKKVHAGTTESTTPIDDALAIVAEALELEIQALLLSEKKTFRQASSS